jgi:hypothetical protein
MYKRIFFMCSRVLLLGLFLALAMNSGNAQSKKKTKQNGMPQGTAQKMRSTTNKQRWLAATRHADARAARIRAARKGGK